MKDKERKDEKNMNIKTLYKVYNRLQGHDSYTNYDKLTNFLLTL